MSRSILVALKDSATSRAVVEFLCDLPLDRPNTSIKLIHVFRQVSASEELMGEAFLREEPSRRQAALENARGRLLEKGFSPDNISMELVSTAQPTISDGIIEQCRRQEYRMVIIGRKRKSRSEEFVLGDISIKLVRALEGKAVLVVKAT